MDGTLPSGPTLVYDEDRYYMGGVIAEKLKAAGVDVTLCTPSEVVSEWAGKTSERWRIRTQLMQLGIGIKLAHALTSFDGKIAKLACQFTGAVEDLCVRTVVMVTQRAPNDALYHDILATVQGDAGKLPFTLTRIGDCEAPAIVAAATYAGHRFARNLEEKTDIDQPLKHDRVDVGADAASDRRPEVSQKYLETLLQYYEEEIEGEAYFAGIADRLTASGQKEKFTLLSEMETYTAAAMKPLVEKYGLSPRSIKELHANGYAQAAKAPVEWDMLIVEMQKTFPQFIVDFERLEAMAPSDDQPGLKVATAHEVAAVDFLNREAANDAASSEPLRSFLKTGVAKS
jgi:dimethylamine/trimethylamine dehydrogenase